MIVHVHAGEQYMTETTSYTKLIAHLHTHPPVLLRASIPPPSFLPTSTSPFNGGAGNEAMLSGD